MSKHKKEVSMVIENGQPILNEGRLPIYWNSGVAQRFATQWGPDAVVVSVTLNWNEDPLHGKKKPRVKSLTLSP